MYSPLSGPALATRAERICIDRLGLNPCVAVRELRMRLRGARPFRAMLAYVLALCAVALVPLMRPPAVSGHRSLPHGSGPFREIGRSAFEYLAHSQIAMLAVMLPAIAAGAITMEREKRTLEMMRASLLSASDVVTGKLLAVVAVGALLLMSSLPVAAWCNLLRGVSPWEITAAYAVMLGAVVWMSALGVAVSTLMQRPIGAIVAAYALLFLLYLAALPAVQQENPLELSVWGMGETTATACVLGAVGVLWALLSVAEGNWRTRAAMPLLRAAGLRGAVAAVVFLLCIYGIAVVVPPLSHVSVACLALAQPSVTVHLMLHGYCSQVAVCLTALGMILFGAAGLWALAIHSYSARN